MCVTKEVSLVAFIVCISACIYLYRRDNPNDRWIAIAFIYLGSMQLIEYFIWSDQACTGLNQRMTSIAFWQNILQPIVALAIAYYFTGGNLPTYVYLVIGLYIVTSLPNIWKAKKPGQCSRPCGKSIGLSWDYTNTKSQTYVWAIFCIAVAIPFLCMEKDGEKYAGLIIGTYVMAHFISVARCPASASPSNGSWWCLMAVIIPILAIQINK
jgi:hypothetical protein